MVGREPALGGCLEKGSLGETVNVSLAPRLYRCKVHSEASSDGRLIMSCEMMMGTTCACEDMQVMAMASAVIRVIRDCNQNSSSARDD